MISHRAAWLRAVQRDVETGATRQRGYVVMFGLFHMSGWSSIETAWSIDRPVHLVQRAEPHELLGVVERHGASTLYCIPAVWQRILDEPTGHDTSPVVEALTGTSLVTLELIDGIKARFPGSWTSIAYGSTEIGRGATLLDADPLRPSRQRRATTADGDRAPHRRRRALVGGTDPLLRLPRPARRDPRSRSTTKAGSTTGDLATCDDEGFLTITGRRSESIRSGGEWVAPVEVEDGDPHPSRGAGGRGGGTPGRALGGSWSAPRSSCDPVPPCRRSTSCVSTGVGVDRRQAAARRGAGRRPPPHRRHRSDPPAASARPDRRRSRPLNFTQGCVS